MTVILHLEIHAQEAERNYEKGGKVRSALGNLPPSAPQFLSLTSPTFNRQSQFAGREAPCWQEMKPPQLLDTRLADSAILLFLSIPSSILLPASPSTSKALTSNAETLLVTSSPPYFSFCTASLLFPPSNSSGTSFAYVSQSEGEKVNVMKVIELSPPRAALFSPSNCCYTR